MEDGKVPFLCGGVFFFILTQAVLPNASARDHRDGVSDDHSDPVVMRDLIYTFTGESGYGTRKDTSAFKNCQSEGGKNVPFNKKSDIAVYDDEVRHEYRKALRRMCEFAEWHLDPKKSEWLVKACLYLIDKDQSIDDVDQFCVRSDGTFLTKSEVVAGSSFELQPFLLGVLHYILLHRANMNRKGVATLNEITSQDYRKSREYNGKLDHAFKRKIDVKWREMPEDNETPVVDVADDYDSDDKVIFDSMAKGISPLLDAVNTQKHQMAETIRQNRRRQEEKADKDQNHDDPDSEQGQAENNTTIIQHQTNVVQNGDHNMNVTNNGIMNFNF